MPLLLALLGVVTGCSQADRPSNAEMGSITSTRFVEPDDGAQAVAASALVFDPPVTLTEQPIYLGREGRGSSAFFGYEEGFVEYYRLTVDDRQTLYGGLGYGGSSGYGRGNWGGWYDRYDRRAYIEKTGSIRR